jgi:predicted 2-oxoglutarate/Fe(II)-dependent dioxygenase YbiX
MTIYLRHGFLDPATCHRVRTAMDGADFEPAHVLTEEISLDLEVRRASSVEVDAETLALVEQAIESERARLEGFFSKRLAEREGAGFLRYGPGGFYRPHRDRGTVPSWPAASRRTVAVVVFLNDGFSGGALRVFGDEGVQEIVPREGTLAAFPAATLHEVAPVIDGTRDTVVDWFY